MIVSIPPHMVIVVFAAAFSGFALVVALAQALVRGRELRRLRKQVADLRRAYEDRSVTLDNQLGGIGLVHYDAFGDASGRLSFSAALLDDRGEGVVLTAINGRTATRTYAKPVTQRDANRLSPEERDAVARAHNGTCGSAQQRGQVVHSRRRTPSAVAARRNP